MANWKRKKSRQRIRCYMCTDGRQGNSDQALYGRRPAVVLFKRLSKLSQKEQIQEIRGSNNE